MAPQKPKILIIEDEKVLRKALVQIFTQENFEVIEAKNGEEGLHLSKQKQPNIILLDVIMPKMDGWTMLEQLRNYEPWGKEVPVIILTNLPSKSDEELKKVGNLHPSYFLLKASTSLEVIVEKVKELLS